MRLSSVVFPAPRKPVRIVMGTALPLFLMLPIVCGFLSKWWSSSKEPGAISTRSRGPCRHGAWQSAGSRPLFLEFAQINIHHLGQLDEIDLLRVGEFGELFAPDVRRIVLPRIDLKIAR